MSVITPPSSPRYQDFLRDIKTQVAQSRLGAARAVNRSLIGLYWALGKMIVERQEELGWGSAVYSSRARIAAFVPPLKKGG